MACGEERSQHTGWISTYGQQAQQCSKRLLNANTRLDSVQGRYDTIYPFQNGRGWDAIADWWEIQAVGVAVVVLN